MGSQWVLNDSIQRPFCVSEYAKFSSLKTLDTFCSCQGQVFSLGVSQHALKTLDTIGNCQRLVFTVGVSQHNYA